jgi:putative glutamine amidotransferase
VTVAIGVCAVVERVRWGPWDQIVAMVPRTYTAAVQAAGAVALALPPDPVAEDEPERFLDRVDGLLLAGGADLDPATCGAEPHPAIGQTWPERDRFEVALTRAAVDRRLPVLGICRGMQLLNAALGGKLIQDLPEAIGSDRHRHTPGSFADHEVRLVPGSLASRAVGAERTTVKSHHHQGIAQLGEGLVATGWSLPDELIEAIELPEHGFALGVLWHPEEDERSRVIAALVAAAEGAAIGHETEEVAR